MEDCPTLIVQLHRKGALHPPPTQNLQMMRSESHEEVPNINIVFQSGTTMVDDKGKKPKDSTWVHKASTKKLKFDLECTKETFPESRKSFTDDSTSRSKDRLEPKMDPSMLTMFLETCMKLLCDRKAIKELQKLINRCDGITPGELCVV